MADEAKKPAVSPEIAQEQANYRRDVTEGAATPMQNTARKAGQGPQSEQKVTRSTEGSVEKTTERK